MKTRSTRRGKRQTFSVAYWLEQGFSITVEASSGAAAERLVQRRLDDETGELPSSTRVHYDGRVIGAEAVRS